MEADTGLDNTGHDIAGRNTSGNDSTGSPGAGSHPPETPALGKLAQDWITLWQSELSAMAADPELQAAWQTMMAMWAGTMSTLLRAIPTAPHPTASRPPHNDRASGHAGTADAPRAPPTAAAPDPRDAEIDRLARHVAALERRLADLERGGDPPVNPKSRPGRKPRR